MLFPMLKKGCLPCSLLPVVTWIQQQLASFQCVNEGQCLPSESLPSSRREGSIGNQICFTFKISFGGSGYLLSFIIHRWPFGFDSRHPGHLINIYK